VGETAVIARRPAAFDFSEAYVEGDYSPRWRSASALAIGRFPLVRQFADRGARRLSAAAPHRHREETIVVVAGTARIVIGDHHAIPAGGHYGGRS
jgi:mannose-6-phosphate isomerase-like protein (cupin superfamily)